MQIPRYITAFLSSCGVLLVASTLNGTEPLKMRLSPTMSIAPGFVRVQVNIEAADENRLLQVIAESPDFYRSSEVQLDGAHAASLNVFEFRNLPTGLYQVTGVLIGTRGQRAVVSGLAKVQPSAGG